MAYKFLKTSFQYLYKFEINSKINGYGSIKVYDNSGNLLYSDTVNSRGHTLYIFNKSLKLISKTYYDSYGEMNTNGITDELNKYLNGNSNYYGYMFAIVTYDAITQDSTFNDLMWSKSDLKNSFHSCLKNWLLYRRSEEGVRSHCKVMYRTLLATCEYGVRSHCKANGAT